MKSLKKIIKYNIGCFGEPMAGKTCLLKYKYSGYFEENTLPTIGIETHKDKEEFDGQSYIFKIHDTAGQERYRSILTSSMKFFDGFLLFFSVIDRTSFYGINNWLHDILDNVDIRKKVFFFNRE